MVTLICYYCIGMPLAWHYGFGPKELGVQGFWTGFFIASLVLAFGLSWVVVRANWEWEEKKSIDEELIPKKDKK